ncbi:response regulator transcription factor [Niabella sp. W65]|nr:response regulator transcription factor [Niabella sp. W65]MCH7363655.1 response regulator transcription factor [Niabella sp. W65]
MGHATNAASCLAFLKQQQPHIILMDINLPDMSGTDLCRTVKRLYPSVFVLGLSTFNQQAVIRNMMESGASGYVLKNADKEELIEAIEMVKYGGTHYSREVEAALKDKQNAMPVITRRKRKYYC